MRTLRTLLCAALTAAPVVAQSPSSDVAMGVFPFLVGNMDGQITTVVDTCAQNGIDTIYVSVFRTTGPSIGELWIDDAPGDWNVAWGTVRRNGAGIDLRRLIAAAHARNLRVVGVLKCFDDTVQPTDAAHRAYLLEIVDYLTDAFDANGLPVFDLDGLALDYVRFVGSGTGNSPTLVTNFVRDVKAHIGGLSLHAYLIANRYTFDGPVYDGQFASYSSVLNGLSSQFGQHWEQLAQYVDVLMPMCYTANGSIYSTYALHQAYVQRAAQYCRTACTNAGVPTHRVQPVIRTYSDSNETATPQTIDASITGALLGGANGYQAFRYGTMQASWWPAFAQWAVPGQNFPIPVLSASSVGVSATLDPRTSRDADQASATLDVRFDWDDDGTFDTPWAASNLVAHVLRSPVGEAFGMQVRDAQGHVSATHRRAVGSSVVTLSTPVLFASTGGFVDIRVDAGPAAAGATYLVLGSLSGTTPGTTWAPGYVVPLNLDAFSEVLFQLANGPLLPNALGVLDANGRATARFVLPAGVAGSLGTVPLAWSVVGATAQGPLFVGDTRSILILP